MSEEYLVCFDTDRIKEYLLATDKLREVRGASWLLTTLNEKSSLDTVRSICPEYQDVFFAGGAGAVLAPSEEKAKEIITTVEELYGRKTFSGSITGVTVPLRPATRNNGFGRRMGVAALKLRQAKDEKAERVLATIEPYTRPCAACERYPAAKVSPIDDIPICHSCYAKREAFRESKREYEKGCGAKTPEDLSEIGDVAHPPGYVGFIYADGNNMGECANSIKSLEGYKDFAHGLNKLIKDAVNRALEPHLPRDNSVTPYERLLIGGDDLMLITAGDIAVPIALDIADAFEKGSPDILPETTNSRPLTLGIGLVVAHAKFPMAALHRLALELQKKAKQRCAEERYSTSAIDFMVVTAAGSTDVNTLRMEALSQQAFVFPSGERRVGLTQRPYTVPEARQLVSHVQMFKNANFPRTQLQYLYEGLFHSQREAIFRWTKVAGRVKAGHRQVMKEFDAAFGDGKHGLPPWRQSQTTSSKSFEYTSAFGDLVEIYPFVPRGASGAVDDGQD